MTKKQEAVTLTAYNVKTKEKNVPIKNAVITQTSKGAYLASGVSESGDKLASLLGREKAVAAVRAGLARAEGWSLPDEELDSKLEAANDNGAHDDDVRKADSEE